MGVSIRSCLATRPTGQLADRPGKRLAKGEVELHGSGRRGVPCRRRVGLAGELDDKIGVETGLGGRLDIPGPPGRKTEDSQLLRGLIRADPAQFQRPIGREQDQRHPGVVGLEHRGVQVRDRRAGRRDDQRGNTGLNGEPQGEKAADALIDVFPSWLERDSGVIKAVISL